MCSPKKAKKAAATEATEPSRRTFKAGSALLPGSAGVQTAAGGP